MKFIKNITYIVPINNGYNEDKNVCERVMLMNVTMNTILRRATTNFSFS